MSALDSFKRTVGLPTDFGKERPYVRFAYTDETKQAGADADVEYRELDGGKAVVVVTVSEWERDSGEVVRTVREPVSFDAAEGAIVGAGSDQSEILEALVVSMNGMAVIGREDGGAA